MVTTRLIYPVVVTLLAFSAISKTTAQESKKDTGSFTFAAMGDIPYSQEEFKLLRSQLAELEPSIPFVFHVGDIKAGAAPFREDAYSLVAGELKQSKVPVFITLGDNEYNDTANPVLALKYWKKYLGDMHTNWKHGLDVKYQATRRENVAFVHKGVLFVMINLVGSKMHDKQEWETRLKDDAEWIKAGFDRSGEQARGVVIIAHAHATTTRQPIADVLAPLAAKFGKPVLYIHGDGHRWLKDNPFPTARNITRVQVDQGAIAPPVRITVAEVDAKGELFTFDRRMTEEYKQRREAYLKKSTKPAPPPDSKKPPSPSTPEKSRS